MRGLEKFFTSRKFRRKVIENLEPQEIVYVFLYVFLIASFFVPPVLYDSIAVVMGFAAMEVWGKVEEVLRLLRKFIDTSQQNQRFWVNFSNRIDDRLPGIIESRVREHWRQMIRNGDLPVHVNLPPGPDPRFMSNPPERREGLR